jgi:hypothetical protein
MKAGLTVRIAALRTALVPPLLREPLPPPGRPNVESRRVVERPRRREGTADRLWSRFARVRVRAAHRDYKLTDSRPEEWLLIEWPESEEEPTKYWLSTLPKDVTFDKLVDLTKLRWRIERDYRELKQEVGRGHFEGRGWRGFHHHATLCIAAYGFLVSERETIPPWGSCSPTLLKKLTVPDGYRPRGSAIANRTPRPELDRNDASKIDSGTCQDADTMPLLRRSNPKAVA